MSQPSTLADLSETKAAILQALSDRHGQIVAYSNLAAAVDRAKSTVKDHCDDLREAGLIEVRSDPDGSIIQLLDDGQHLLDQGGARSPTGANAPRRSAASDGENRVSGGERRPNGDRDSQRHAPARAHYVTATADVVNADALPDGWRSRWLEHTHQDVERAESSDAYVVVEEGVRFRVHRDSVSIILKESVTRSRVSDAVDAVMDKVFRAAEWLRAVLPEPATLSLQGLRIGTTHLALVDHYLAGYVRDREDLELSEIVVEDRETGDQRIILDESDQAETEAVHEETAEDDAAFLQEQLEWKIHNKDAARRLRDVPERVDELEQSMRRTSRLLEQLVELKAAEAVGTGQSEPSREPEPDAGTGDVDQEPGPGVVPDQPVPAARATSDNIERGVPNNGGVTEARRREVRQAKERIGTDGLWNDETGSPDRAG